MPGCNKLYQPDMMGNQDWIPKISGFFGVPFQEYQVFLESNSKNIRFFIFLSEK